MIAQKPQKLFGLPLRYFPLIPAILLITILIGCADNRSVNPDTAFDAGDGIYSTGSGMNKKFAEADADLIKTVIQATARYHSITQAQRAGYEGDDNCVAIPGVGGMGYHWVNESLIDPVFDPANPEVLLYAPDRNGNLKLVGVEYIVIDIGQDHPHFGDYPFDVNGTPIEDDHWSLHVWLWEDNPLGLFEPFNPNVSCP
jgi:hypothetical protein